MAARIDPAEDDVGDAMPGLLAEIPAFEQGRRVLREIVDRERPSVEQDHDRRLVEREDGARELVLRPDHIERVAIAEMIVGPGLAARLLVAAEHQDDRVGVARGLDRLGAKPIVDRGRGRRDLVLRPHMAFGEPHAFGIIDLEMAAAFLLHRLEDRDDMARHVAIAADGSVASMGADHGHAADAAGVERQQVVLVAEQHHRAPRRLASERDRVRSRGQGVGPGGIDIGMFEEPCLELHAKHAAHGIVDLRHRHPPFAKQLRQEGIGLAIRHFLIDAGVHRHRPGVGKVGRHVMTRDQLADREIIADHRALESPFAAKHVVQHPAICVARHAVHLVVGRHHRADRQRMHGPFERREEDLTQGALAERRRPGIGAALGLAVAGHVLERGEHPFGPERKRRALETADRGERHLAHQIGVLAIGFLDPTPARIARDIDDRGEREMDAARPHLARGDVEHALDQGGIPGRGKADRLRETGGVARDIAVQRLFVEQDRNAEPGALHRPMLRGIDIVRGLARASIGLVRGRAGGAGCGRRGDSATIRRARDLTDAVRKGRDRALGGKMPVGRLDPILVLPDGDELRHLLVEGHAREQVLDPALDRLGRVLVEGGRAFRRRGGEGKPPAESQGACRQNAADPSRLAGQFHPHPILPRAYRLLMVALPLNRQSRPARSTVAGAIYSPASPP